MSEVKKKQKFLAAFGIVSTDTATARQKDVAKLLGEIRTQIEKLPEGDWSDQPRKKYGEDLEVLVQSLAALPDKPLTDKQKYAACGTIEEKAKAIAAKVKVLVIAEEKLVELKKLKPDEIDKLVAKKGTKVTTPEDQGFMVAAIRARFDVDQMYGDLTSSALPRFYKTLSMVPEEHARLNPRLKNIKRGKASGDSDYFGSVININAGETGPWKSSRTKYQNSEGKELSLDNFDAHTLHEVGHAVDDAAGYMDDKRGNLDFGGWEDSSVAEVRDIMLQKLQKKWGKRLDTPTLSMLAETALGGNFKIDIDIIRKEQARATSMTRKEVLEHPAIKDADAAIAQFLNEFADDLDNEEEFSKHFIKNDYVAQIDKTDNTRFIFLAQIINTMRQQKARAATIADEMCGPDNAPLPLPEQSVLDELENDPVFQWAAAMQQDFWFAGSSVIDGSAWNGFIYHKDKQWWKYPAAARGTMVGDYQFRSPAEWFAEVYAVHMLGKLPSSHPLSKLIDGITPKQATN